MPLTPVAGHAGLLIGCRRRHALPGGRSCSQALLKAWSVVPLLFAPAAPDHLPYVHRHLTRIHRLALHACSDGELCVCAIVKPFDFPGEYC